MKILVTGGAGFIGSNFVHYYLKNHPKDNLVVLDKLTYAGHKVNLKGLDLEFIKGDIANPKIVDKAFAGIDIVVHFAAESHVDRSIIGPEEFIKTNIVGTQVLLQAALRHDIRHFHHVSTDEVFGSLPADPSIKFTEETPYKPHSPYSASKASSDHLVRSWFDTYHLPVTITNTSNNYGPFHDPEKLIPRFITNLILGKKVPLMGRGENIRDWCFVTDHCRAIDMVISASQKDKDIVGQTFCVGGNAERTNLQVTQELLKILSLDESRIEFVPHRLGHDSRYAIDSSKINRVLGWIPEHTFEESLLLTVRWFQENQDWWLGLLKDRPSIDALDQMKKLKMV